MINQNKKMPLVSVIMATYNDELYIRDSINSILMQDYPNIELIVVDDASTDSTNDILKEFQNRIIVITNKTNKKLAYCLNLAIKEAHGEYIARMDADDIAVKNRISIQVNYLEKNQMVDVCGGFAKTFGMSKGILKYPLTHDEIKTHLLFENALCHPAIMFRASSMDYEYDSSLSAGQDYELWSRIVLNKKLANIPKVLINYRIHSKQTRCLNNVQQKIGALMAKKRMYTLLGDDSERYLDEFLDFSMLGKARNADEMRRYEEMIFALNEYNNISGAFPKVYFWKVAVSFYYLNWAYSVMQSSLSFSLIHNSKLKREINKVPLSERCKYISLIIRNKVKGAVK